MHWSSNMFIGAMTVYCTLKAVTHLIFLAMGTVPQITSWNLWQDSVFYSLFAWWGWWLYRLHKRSVAP